MNGKRIIQTGRTRGTAFKHVARVRLEDAAVLLGKNRFSGAIYLAGYAVECLLKWAVTEHRECIYLPAELEIHILQTLLQEAGLQPWLRRHVKLETAFCGLSKSWGPKLRYLTKEPEPKHAKRLYEQIVEVYDWIAEQKI